MSLETVSFGEILSDLRAFKKVSVEELATEICSIEELIEYEKGKKYPTLDQLYEIADRLNVEVSYFINYASSSTFNYVTAVFQLIKKYKRERDYEAIYEIIDRERENPLFKQISSQQFMLWHEGICKYYLHNNLTESVQLLYRAIDLTNPDRNNLSEHEIEILTSLAIIKFEESDFIAATNIFEDALDNLDSLPHILDPKVKLRILYGLSQTLSGRDLYNESLKYSNLGINYCINNELLYLFGEFYYQSGENYIKIDEIEKGIEYINKAKEVFILQNDEKFAKLVSLELDKLLEKC
ncbi:helix-turn-helix domain-containing protein [Cytobacillus purgationiresistens]|uniref:Transcriptional regulator with XRE-family HTH domain n=1 Tax=Cytobacillus purgationiresistens TaxID=863449 RepID=A0ABU0AEJ2_9BACI|nr:helix-turn-helix domain-containing protein [Cytobacillus purgationiresistens]MDQ0269212.1 transcriptional regulator with XRE-family HTH domain [Cytobacillus purgationiresistens]